MGTSKRSQGKKENKETQSPVLKIFNQAFKAKEQPDPEKATLLKDKQKEKKRKSYAGFRKADQKSYDSSSTDRYRHKHNKFTIQGVKEERNEGTPPLQGDVKEAWWAQRTKAKKSDDTCSCVSCALKKVLASEYTCMACLLVLFSVSVVGAFLLVFKSSPILEVTKPEENKIKKMQVIKRQLSDEGPFKKTWDGLQNLASYSGLFGSELFIQQNKLEDMEGISGDLASVLDTDKISESTNSVRLRDFYKKLIKTDAQIKKLKDSLNNYQGSNMKTFYERFKRSLVKPKQNYKENNFHSKERVKNKKVILFNTDNKMRLKKSPKLDNSTAGLFVKEEKFYVKYGPIQRQNYPRCHHPHDANHHEKKLKHPFYKISQRFDEMLNKYMTTKRSNVPEDTSVLKSNKMRFNKKLDTRDIVDLSTEIDLIDGLEYLDITQNDITTTTNGNEENTNILFSQSSDDESVNKYLKANSGRKLLQYDEEGVDNVGYEDFKEVLTDDQQNHDEMDQTLERVKRNNGFPMTQKHIGSDVYNRNWKGPMPLYPDEINAMIKQAALHNLNIQVPVDTKDIRVEKDISEQEISDTEYLEDYLDNKYKSLVGMAQAYSDYGVLDIKKEDNSESTTGTEDASEKYKFISRNLFKKGAFGRTKKDWESSEGIQIKYKPSPRSDSNLFKILREHIQFSRPSPTYGSLKSEKVFTPSGLEIQLVTDIPQSKGKENDIYKFKVPQRSLQSINTKVLIDQSTTTNKVKEDTIKLTTLKSMDILNMTGADQETNRSMALGDFLNMMRDWFFHMAVVSGDLEDKGRILEKNIDKHEISESPKKNLTTNQSREYIFDSEKNGIHEYKSRKLLSLEENKTVTEIKQEADSKTLKHVDVNATLLPTFNNTIATTNPDVRDKNKTLFKRSVENNNFIFWNDMYDEDEYGAKIDYFDDVIRNKHTPKYYNKVALLKSKDWVQSKMKGMSNKIRDDLQRRISNLNTRMSSKLSQMPAQNPNRRPLRSVDTDSEDVDVAKSFAVLNANLKHVCRQAAEAVRNTRKIEAREENNEASQATGLMQQLVHLMADLVDIQVQQKTCAKLPADLRDFLEWLVVPPEYHPNVDSLSSMSEYSHLFSDDSRYEKSSDIYDLPLTEDTHQEDRTECLGTIRAVQDLIQQYEGMSDEDKSKMAGVKEYLENQLEFLNGKLNSLNEYDTLKFRKREARNKRSLKHPRFKRLFNRYINNFARKHTKTTVPTKITKARILDKEKSNNDDKKIVKEFGNSLSDKEIEVSESANRLKEPERKSRNLKDVYFKALDEARKTTVKKN
ncbi:unnamed protein product [Leptosia nina]|uniref:Uncharacterized protein n=1 Tax=Leptosia nina TaxID=320188 RepID=A0AAV1JKQ0_9NEOP